MAYGTAAVDVIQSSTTGTPVQFQDGSGTQIGTLCRAWVSIAGSSTPTIRASFNVSSITRNGAGDYTIAFTTALADANYSAVASSSLNSATGYNYPEVFSSASASVAPTTASFRVGSYSNTDPVYMNIAVFR